MKRTTINKEEIDKFSKIADEWWVLMENLNLYKFNPIRIKYIRDSLIKINKKSKKNYLLMDWIF